MGGGQTSSGSSSQQPTIPKWLKPYYQNTAKQLIAAQGALPSLSQLYGQVPLLGIPGLGEGELTDIAGLQGAAASQNPLVGQGAAGLQQFLPGSGGGMAPALAEAEGIFNTQTAPEILGQASLMGLGNSGAGLAALSQGQQEAYLPLIEQGTQNEFNAASQLGALGQNQEQIQQEQLINALTAAGLPREIATHQAQSLFNQQQQRFQFASGIQGGGQSQFPALLGQISNSLSSLTQPKF